jgi:hypothetical protein
MKIDSRLLALEFALVLGATMGCAKGTYLEVRFTGPMGLPEIDSIGVTLTLTEQVGGPILHSSDTVTRPNNAPITLPTSMAFKLDNDSGQLVVDAIAYGRTGLRVAAARNTTTIMHAETWMVTLDFGGGGTDGGTDGP